MENKIIIPGTKNKIFLLFDLPLGGAAGPELTGMGIVTRSGRDDKHHQLYYYCFLGAAPAICCNLLHTREAK